MGIPGCIENLYELGILKGGGGVREDILNHPNVYISIEVVQH